MVDKFNEYLTNYRDRIARGDLKKLKEEQASGKVVYDKKKKALAFAIKEAEECTESKNEKSTRSRKNFKEICADFWADPVWSTVIATGIIAVLSILISVGISGYKYFSRYEEPIKIEKRDVIKVGNKEVYELKVDETTIKTRECYKNKMPTLLSLFECDFGSYQMTTSQPWEANISNICHPDGQQRADKKIEILINKYLDFNQSKSVFSAVYVPSVASSDVYDVIDGLAENMPMILKDMEQTFPFEVTCPVESRQVKSGDLVFTGAVYIYHETFLSDKQKVKLREKYRNLGLSIDFRGPAYLIHKQNVFRNTVKNL